MIITVGGTPVSGKSSVAKKLADKLGYKHYSVGDFYREEAKERGLSFQEMVKLWEKDKAMLTKGDERTKRLGETENNFVIDGHAAFHFIPHAIKIFLTVDIGEAARRCYRDRKSTEGITSLAQAKKSVLARGETLRKKLKATYGFDAYDEKNYDYIVNTTHNTPEKTLRMVESYVRKKM
jgi:CMP/dCMP kinase